MPALLFRRFGRGGPIRVLWLQRYELETGSDALTSADVNMGDPPGPRRGQGLEQLHRLKNENRRARLDGVAELHLDLGDDTRHRCRDDVGPDRSGVWPLMSVERRPDRRGVLDVAEANENSLSIHDRDAAPVVLPETKPDRTVLHWPRAAICGNHAPEHVPAWRRVGLDCRPVRMRPADIKEGQSSSVACPSAERF